ncbi:hypothetical protein NEUTE1DRAFT_107076 [Neurospora tetrasperma FGSC 2508]|uniref:Uncharacterized protein n=1 Tax=Neurospora tetrasperma (strain FGSC 2508 / ATCC MYA-4615 / P0657) TaxID=510951 RepID=F8MCE9_NEUT8|nr:uncharacterized protein NEUTE1DRAFT_107076 [Neurospora tetrasperma FGSC 2508]EGO60450.1 hypothetical protein NEUTE1DRAFT_107076 [Neurospora tetrasperma FGSC 2508]EGZ75574.1 hypothetical protein NEUTE2DRAFT_136689 [Neurospora tetrasperma FGSC 2509]
MEHRGFSLLAVLSQGRAGRKTEVAEHRRHLANRWTRRETEQVNADDLDHNRINDKSHQLLRSDAADRLPSSENHGRSLALIFPTDTAQERSLKLGRNRSVSGAQTIRHGTGRPFRLAAADDESFPATPSALGGGWLRGPLRLPLCSWCHPFYCP